MEWLNGFFIPLIKVIFIGGIILTIGFYLYKGFSNAWLKQTKWFIKYKLPYFNKPYPENIVKWCLECIDEGIGYYDAKRLLFLNNTNEKNIYETLFIFDEILNEMNEKGGKKTYGRKFERSNCKNEITELPKVK